MFFGATVKPQQSYSLEPTEGEVLHLSGACLQNPTSNNRVFLVIKQDGKEHTVCVLKKESMENVSLDIFLATRAGVEFKVQGDQDVHIFGYYEPTGGSDDEDDDDDDEDDDDEDASDEDMADASSKKSKQLVSAEASKDSDDDDDDEDDDDEDEDGDDSDNDNDDDDDEDDDVDEEELNKKVQEMARQMALDKSKKDKKNKHEKSAPAPTPAAPEKKRKAQDNLVKGKPGKQMKSDDNSGASQFEKTIQDYLKKHGRSQVSQVASACPKPASITSKYREFLVSRPSLFNIEGNFVSLKQ